LTNGDEPVIYRLRREVMSMAKKKAAKKKAAGKKKAAKKRR